MSDVETTVADVAFYTGVGLMAYSELGTFYAGAALFATSLTAAIIEGFLQ